MGYSTNLEQIQQDVRTYQLQPAQIPHGPRARQTDIDKVVDRHQTGTILQKHRPRSQITKCQIGRINEQEEEEREHQQLGNDSAVLYPSQRGHFQEIHRRSNS